MPLVISFQSNLALAAIFPFISCHLAGKYLLSYYSYRKSYSRESWAPPYRQSSPNGKPNLVTSRVSVGLWNSTSADKALEKPNQHQKHTQTSYNTYNHWPYRRTLLAVLHYIVQRAASLMNRVSGTGYWNLATEEVPHYLEMISKKRLLQLYKVSSRPPKNCQKDWKKDAKL